MKKLFKFSSVLFGITIVGLGIYTIRYFCKCIDLIESLGDDCGIR